MPELGANFGDGELSEQGYKLMNLLCRPEFIDPIAALSMKFFENIIILSKTWFGLFQLKSKVKEGQLNPFQPNFHVRCLNSTCFNPFLSTHMSDSTQLIIGVQPSGSTLKTGQVWHP